MSTPRSVAVVIPARDEEELIARCLESVATAVGRVNRQIQVVTVVVADRCTDATATIARELDAQVREIDAGCVGRARSTGVQEALKALAVGKTWIATTDADSVVPANWLTEQLALAERGWDAIIGTVRPDFADLSDAQVEAWLATHDPLVPNGHVHGANLGVRAAPYLRVGGFGDLALHEDNDLVARLRASGARIAASSAIEVVTSGRQHGRAPGGYAQHLREELVP